MHTLFYNPDGMHIIEMMLDASMSDLLPGLLPTEDNPGDAWEDYGEDYSI